MHLRHTPLEEQILLESSKINLKGVPLETTVALLISVSLGFYPIHQQDSQIQENVPNDTLI